MHLYLICRFLLVAGALLLVSGCAGKIDPNSSVKNGEHIFEACKGYLKRQGVTYDEAETRARAYSKSGDKKNACKFRRKAVAALDDAMQSFKSGKCQKFHKVANGYISWKVKGLQSKIANQRKNTAAKLPQVCS